MRPDTTQLHVRIYHQKNGSITMTVCKEEMEVSSGGKIVNRNAYLLFYEQEEDLVKIGDGEMSHTLHHKSVNEQITMSKEELLENFLSSLEGTENASLTTDERQTVPTPPRTKRRDCKWEKKGKGVCRREEKCHFNHNIIHQIEDTIVAVGMGTKLSNN